MPLETFTKRIGGQMHNNLRHRVNKIWDPSLLALMLLILSMISSFCPGFRWLGFAIPSLLLAFPKWWENCLLSLPVSLISIAVILITIGNYIGVFRSAISPN